MTSPLAKKIVGTFILDDLRVRPPVYAWSQRECREGSLRPLVDEFVSAQEEPLDPGLLLVEKVEPTGITCCIPCKLFDGEGPSAFSTSVWLKLDPTTWQAVRIAEPL